MQTMIRILLSTLALPILAAAAAPQKAANSRIVAVYTYVDVADLVLVSDLVIEVRLKSAKKLGKDFSKGVAPGYERYLVSGDVISLIRGQEGIDPRLSWIVDQRIDSRSGEEKLAKGNYIIFAKPSRPGEVRLVAPDAQMPTSPEAGSMVRRIIAEALKPDAAPAITGINAAFNSPGNLPGEGETQIFLDSDDGRPVSISVARHPDKPVSWQVSVGEIVQEGAGPPKKNSLLWYRLACFLPAQLPTSAFSDESADAQATVKRDYAVVKEGLGECRRARKQ